VSPGPPPSRLPQPQQGGFGPLPARGERGARTAVPRLPERLAPSPLPLSLRERGFAQDVGLESAVGPVTIAAMTVSRLRFALVAASLVATTASAAAQEREGSGVVAADRSAVVACLRESEGTPRACIGAVAVPCAREGSGDRRDAAVECSRREAAVWRERLDFAGRVVAARLESGPRSRLGALQRSWEEYVSQKCALAGELQPASRAPLMQAGCDLRETALRAIEMEGLAERPQRAAEPRPRLER
jgi:Lysozyme inhibitor LprI